ncbi:TMEM165/GDT1 family protein [Haloechinothrix sp. LS1_15]|uniref:TMEM165/GDT1 family protein n=1 Tax=Haloechinothrix sp. LS1_15 TaxID=2652248 RepID=UPI0029449E26|nr:TMEM165/GDT1 family protein [Haloechinothrix sp. LS1_15]MDV6014521.1 UPF0016 domain-containing protein [Haloechinothrix sp. LS1_15]
MSAELLAFASALAFVLAVELPDKTSVAVLVLTTRYRVAAVLLGVSTAFAVHTVLAVAFGSALTLLPGMLVSLAVAAVFGAGAYLLLREGFRRAEVAPEDASMQGSRPVTFARAAMTSFAVLFLAELGDASQLATAGLTARSSSPIAVGLGSFTALVLVALLAIVAGRKLRARINPRLLHRIAGFTFAALAGLALLSAFNG